MTAFLPITDTAADDDVTAELLSVYIVPALVAAEAVVLVVHVPLVLVDTYASERLKPFTSIAALHMGLTVMFTFDVALVPTNQVAFTTGCVTARLVPVVAPDCSPVTTPALMVPPVDQGFTFTFTGA